MGSSDKLLDAWEALGGAVYAWTEPLAALDTLDRVWGLLAAAETDGATSRRLDMPRIFCVWYLLEVVDYQLKVAAERAQSPAERMVIERHREHVVRRAIEMRDGPELRDYHALLTRSDDYRKLAGMPPLPKD